ncbi:MAG: hypothetical protein FWF71_04655 [Actinomycetia bacterium]|nr:hypothetical protein [Actinomycetes bacterium]
MRKMTRAALVPLITAALLLPLGTCGPGPGTGASAPGEEWMPTAGQQPGQLPEGSVAGGRYQVASTGQGQGGSGAMAFSSSIYDFSNIRTANLVFSGTVLKAETYKYALDLPDTPLEARETGIAPPSEGHAGYQADPVPR